MGTCLKSPKDKKTYRRLVLPNALTVLLVSDPDISASTQEQQGGGAGGDAAGHSSKGDKGAKVSGRRAICTHGRAREQMAACTLCLPACLPNACMHACTTSGPEHAPMRELQHPRPQRNAGKRRQRGEHG